MPVGSFDPHGTHPSDVLISYTFVVRDTHIINGVACFTLSTSMLIIEINLCNQFISKDKLFYLPQCLFNNITE